MTNWKNLEGASIADNPCWGGPEAHHHDLQYLLRVLGGDAKDGGDNITERSTIGNITADASSYSAALIDRVIARLVIFNDDNYIAIHKPADLRMDGPHLATVHKLLLYLYPPPSILQNTTIDEVVHQRSHEHLIKSIAPLTNTSDLKDDPFRTVHQLDYATSGVLLMAKNRKAAGTACISFQERKAKKTYVAVVTTASTNITNRSDDSTDNSLPFGPDFFDSIPKLPKSSLQPWAAGTLEQKYRKKRRRDTDGKDTFNGYMPEHSIFAKWRGSIIKKRKEEKMKSAGGDGGGGEGKPPSQQQKKKHWKKKQNNNDDSVMVTQLIQSTTQHLTSHDIDELLSIGPSWKKVKAHCESSTNDNIFRWPSTVEQMTKEYNQMTMAAAATTETDEKLTKQSESSEDNINATIKDESASSSLPPLFRIESDDDANSFYICASIGEVGDGRFDVLVDPSLALPETQHNVPTILPEMKPSLTKCTVLWRGYVKDTIKGSAEEGEQQQQLRVPVAKVLLSPWTGRRHQLRVHLSRIAGCPILGDVAYTKGSDDRGVIGSRMCLHAKELCIPLIGSVAKTFTAQDPFVVEDDDSIQIDNFC